ncbi:hypothetical protein FA13DRAFT_1732651 [Coprinellus micaceus]|uniref:Uncharacterized protein n=1 Tax=Coprinellus micaceus TaxID=71717 RepID=A0A4Y7TB26_COPMI|nr:hypothetical protein FA13DRAFT_1732651 [Coprinellus micaceus]
MPSHVFELRAGSLPSHHYLKLGYSECPGSDTRSPRWIPQPMCNRIFNERFGYSQAGNVNPGAFRNDNPCVVTHPILIRRTNQEDLVVFRVPYLSWPIYRPRWTAG